MNGPQIVRRTDPSELEKSEWAQAPDRALVELALEGHKRAFEALVERYAPMIAGFLHRNTRSQEDAEDLAQETFLKAHRRLGRLREKDRVGPWLTRIARNCLIDHYRARGRSPRVVWTDSSGDEQAEGPSQRLRDPKPGPYERARQSEIKRAIFRAIDGLGDKYRLILYWRLLGGESSETIARRLDLKPSTIRGRLYRGLRKLRKTLAKQGITP